MKEITPAMLGTRETIRENVAGRGEEIYRIPISKIVVRDGFNVRQDFGDIQSLADSILANGQITAVRVDAMADGTFALTDGHRRFSAMQIIQKSTGHDAIIKAIVNNRATTEEERILQMFTTQDNKPLEPHEVAELIKRLINIGYDQSEVAKKIGKRPDYVSRMLSFANESGIVKDAVKRGEVSVSAVLEVKKAIPSQQERNAAISNAVVSGGKTSAAAIIGARKPNPRERVNQLEELLEEILPECPANIQERIKTVLK